MTWFRAAKPQRIGVRPSPGAATSAALAVWEPQEKTARRTNSQRRLVFECRAAEQRELEPPLSPSHQRLREEALARCPAANPGPVIPCVTRESTDGCPPAD